jgi:hypothetical protein
MFEGTEILTLALFIYIKCVITFFFLTVSYYSHVSHKVGLTGVSACSKRLSDLPDVVLSEGAGDR